MDFSLLCRFHLNILLFISNFVFQVQPLRGQDPDVRASCLVVLNFCCVLLDLTRHIIVY
jgi:hypothetical protein